MHIKTIRPTTNLVIHTACWRVVMRCSSLDLKLTEATDHLAVAEKQAKLDEAKLAQNKSFYS